MKALRRAACILLAITKHPERRRCFAIALDADKVFRFLFPPSEISSASIKRLMLIVDQAFQGERMWRGLRRKTIARWFIVAAGPRDAFFKRCGKFAVTRRSGIQNDNHGTVVILRNVDLRLFA